MGVEESNDGAMNGVIDRHPLRQGYFQINSVRHKVSIGQNYVSWEPEGAPDCKYIYRLMGQTVNYGIFNNILLLQEVQTSAGANWCYFFVIPVRVERI